MDREIVAGDCGICNKSLSASQPAKEGADLENGGG
jgi:hypothetical protein